MATYKVLQDIEAEDKLFGPFTLKQFIFGGITIVIGFIGFRILLAGVPIFIKAPFLLVLLPFFILFGFLAAPIMRDQSTEVWLLARLRFLFKSRIRIWSQDGISELVTITVPKKIERIYSNNFTQDEVKSRLKALANTVDSRGWAVKNVNANMFNQPGYLTDNGGDSDRLIDPASIPQEVPAVDVLASDDMLDPLNSATGQNFAALMQQSSAQHKQQIASSMQRGQTTPTFPTPSQPTEPPTDYYFMNQPQIPKDSIPQDFSTFSSQQVVAPGTDNSATTAVATEAEEALAHKIAEDNQRIKSYQTDHGRILQPLHDKEGNNLAAPNTLSNEGQDQQTGQDTRQIPVNPAIIELAQNDDLNVATLARQANRLDKSDKPDNGEVVISLH